MGRLQYLKSIEEDGEMMQLTEKLEDVTKEDILNYKNYQIMVGFYDELLKDESIKGDKDIYQLILNFKETRVDITSAQDLSFLRVKKDQAYVPAGLTPAADLSKGEAIDFFHHVAAKIKQGNDLYNFKARVDKENSIYIFNGDNFQTGPKAHSGKVEEPITVKEVEPPSILKEILHALFGRFGLFKKEFDDYHAYQEKKRQYDEAYLETRREQKRLDDVTEEVSRDNRKFKELRQAYNKVNKSILSHRTPEESMQLELEKEKNLNATIELIAGRSNDVSLFKGNNYHELANTPLVESDDLPMGGLALLSVCSLKLNCEVEGELSTGMGQMKDPGNLNPEEQKFLEDINHSAQVVETSGKVFNSIFSGSDVRMNLRMANVIRTRKALNAAVEAWKTGDKQPLADLINDAIEPLYHEIRNVSGTVSKQEGQAAGEIIDALDTLFQKDPEMKSKINLSDERWNQMKGLASIVHLVTRPKERKYEALKQDEGPNTPKRAELVDDLLYRHILAATLASERQKEADSAISNSKPFPKAFDEKVKPVNELLTMIRVNQCYYSDKLMKCNSVIELFSKQGRKPEQIKEMFMDVVRDTEEYKKLLSMDKKTLFAEENFEKSANRLMTEVAARKKARESRNEGINLIPGEQIRQTKAKAKK